MVTKKKKAAAKRKAPAKKKAATKKTAAKKAPVKKSAAKKTAAPKKAATSPPNKKAAADKAKGVKLTAPQKPRKPTRYITYAAGNEERIYSEPGGKKEVNRVLLGTFLSVTAEKTVNGEKWLEVYTYGDGGWLKESNTTKDKHMKVFYIDVGQGDGALLEIGDITMLLDGGPRRDNNVIRYLNWQYGPIIRAKKKVHIHYIFISHFDEDHYGGLIEVIKNSQFTFDTIYVAGIIKFKAGAYDTTLGNVKDKLLTTYIEDLEDLRLHKENAQPVIADFITAVENAKKEGRLKNGIKRLDHTSGKIFDAGHKINGHSFNIEVLGPIFREEDGKKGFAWLKNESHTINGHSLVLKFNYGKRTFLFGGDLNTDAEVDLLDFYKDQPNILKVDIAKSCHHGASEFTEDFMAELSPFATVISSGDNETYSHPRADAIGCAGKYSSGKRPLVFSTELARSTKLATQEIQYGMINLRCNGKEIYLAQKKEAKNPVDIWDSYGPL